MFVQKVLVVRLQTNGGRVSSHAQVRNIAVFKETWKQSWRCSYRVFARQ